MKISVCIITLNEEQNLERCLKSVEAFADEIILLDSGSTDKTCEIAKKFKANIVRQDWKGYVKQKNEAFRLASGDWIFSIDADEEVSEKLREEILYLREVSGPQHIDGFKISRVVFFEGKWIRFGDWYPDRLVRFFRKGRAQVVGGKVHERIVLSGSSELLEGELYHYTYQNRQDQIQRIDHYSSLWAEDAFSAGRRAWFWTPWGRSFWRFLRGFLLKKGFIGGALGWHICRTCSFEVWLKYQKLRNLCKLNKQKETS